MKEITELSEQIWEEVSELNKMIENRLRELYEISKEKGINDFGWKDNVPSEDDFETEEDFESANEEFQDHAFNLIRYGWDYASNTREFPCCYRFKFDDKGSLVIAAYYDESEGEPHTDCDIVISVNDGYNYRQLVEIIHIIENDLCVEELTIEEQFEQLLNRIKTLVAKRNNKELDFSNDDDFVNDACLIVEGGWSWFNREEGNIDKVYLTESGELQFEILARVYYGDEYEIDVLQVPAPKIDDETDSDIVSELEDVLKNIIDRLESENPSYWTKNFLRNHIGTRIHLHFHKYLGINIDVNEKGIYSDRLGDISIDDLTEWIDDDGKVIDNVESLIRYLFDLIEDFNWTDTDDPTSPFLRDEIMEYLWQDGAQVDIEIYPVDENGHSGEVTEQYSFTY